MYISPHVARSEAVRRLERALAPASLDEKRVVLWLEGWEVSTMDAISAMVERSVSRKCPQHALGQPERDSIETFPAFELPVPGSFADDGSQNGLNP
jgi:hypothetical protein